MTWVRLLDSDSVAQVLYISSEGTLSKLRRCEQSAVALALALSLVGSVSFHRAAVSGAPCSAIVGSYLILWGSNIMNAFRIVPVRGLDEA